MSHVCMLTTFDNPFNPFEDFDNWRRFDEEKGYYSNNRLARLLEKNNVSIFGDLSQTEIDLETEKAIDEFIAHDFLNIYKKVMRNNKLDNSISDS